ncbi:protein MTL1-like [Miscanthus floridulus]|uniref:protein MTL1-like n=1 Tax=Miscanthus floridulus TaxID=154761 RepID=UPI0034598C14
MAAITSKEKEEALQLKQGESKVFSKLFTRESSAAAPSFRVYYGVASAGSVPFLWESQPGTPKNDAISTATLPPLTPPPSYYTAARQQQQQAAPPHSLSHRHRRNRSSSSSSSSSSTAAAATGKNNKKLSTKHYISIFSAMLPKMILHWRWSSRSAASSGSSPSAASSSCSSSSWSALSSSASSSVSLSSFRSAQSPAACSSMTMRSRVFAFSAADDDSEGEPAAAPMCFSVRHESFRAFRGCRVAMTMKSALASVGGHGGHAAGPTAAQKV